MLFNKYILITLLMEIKNNIDLINNLLKFRNFTVKERYEIVNIAKVSNTYDELVDNLSWDYKYQNIKIV